MALAPIIYDSSICCFRLMSNGVAVAIEIALSVIIMRGFSKQLHPSAQRALEEPSSFDRSRTTIFANN